jgi:hypothetical protein
VSSINVLFEEHHHLWQLARDELRQVDPDAPEWGLLFHEGDRLAGWCTQIAATRSIRQEEIPQLVAFPALDNSGPYASWLRDIEHTKPRVFAYVCKLEQIRIVLLREAGVV